MRVRFIMYSKDQFIMNQLFISRFSYFYLHSSSASHSDDYCKCKCRLLHYFAFSSFYWSSSDLIRWPRNSLMTWNPISHFNSFIFSWVDQWLSGQPCCKSKMSLDSHLDFHMNALSLFQNIFHFPTHNGDSNLLVIMNMWTNSKAITPKPLLNRIYYFHKHGFVYTNLNVSFKVMKKSDIMCYETDVFSIYNIRLVTNGWRWKTHTAFPRYRIYYRTD